MPSRGAGAVVFNLARYIRTHIGTMLLLGLMDITYREGRE